MSKIFGFCEARRHHWRRRAEGFRGRQGNNFAIRPFNCVGTDTTNAVIEAAAKAKAPVIVQFSNGGAQFIAGKGLKLEGQQAGVLGAISGAKHVHLEQDRIDLVMCFAPSCQVEGFRSTLLRC